MLVHSLTKVLHSSALPPRSFARAPDLVAEGLYLGSRALRADKAFLRDFCISHVMVDPKSASRMRLEKLISVAWARTGSAY